MGAYPAQFRVQAPARKGAAGGPAQAEPANRSGITVAYQETSPMRVQGLATGRLYEFSLETRVQEVDLNDAPSLLRTRYFRPA
jgi:hypothetical protein